jgi:hypothetical protein
MTPLSLRPMRPSSARSKPKNNRRRSLRRQQRQSRQARAQKLKMPLSLKQSHPKMMRRKRRLPMRSKKIL